VLFNFNFKFFAGKYADPLRALLQLTDDGFVALVFVGDELAEGVNSYLLELDVLLEPLVLLMADVILLLKLHFLDVLLEHIDALEKCLGFLSVHLIH